MQCFANAEMRWNGSGALFIVQSTSKAFIVMRWENSELEKKKLGKTKRKYVQCMYVWLMLIHVWVRRQSKKSKREKTATRNETFSMRDL